MTYRLAGKNEETSNVATYGLYRTSTDTLKQCALKRRGWSHSPNPCASPCSPRARLSKGPCLRHNWQSRHRVCRVPEFAFGTRWSSGCSSFVRGYRPVPTTTVWSLGYTADQSPNMVKYSQELLTKNAKMAAMTQHPPQMKNTLEPRLALPGPESTR